MKFSSVYQKPFQLEGCHLRLSGKEINQSELFESEYNKCTYENIPSECYTVMIHQIPGNCKTWWNYVDRL